MAPLGQDGHPSPFFLQDRLQMDPFIQRLNNFPKFPLNLFLVHRSPCLLSSLGITHPALISGLAYKIHPAPQMGILSRLYFKSLASKLIFLPLALLPVTLSLPSKEKDHDCWKLHRLTESVFSAFRNISTPLSLRRIVP